MRRQITVFTGLQIACKASRIAYSITREPSPHYMFNGVDPRKPGMAGAFTTDVKLFPEYTYRIEMVEEEDSIETTYFFDDVKLLDSEKEGEYPFVSGPVRKEIRPTTYRANRLMHGGHIQSFVATE